jgi:hypothetical protein
MTQEEKDSALMKKHQELYANWKKNSKPCIICGENEGKEKDHLPPKTLYPRRLRTDQTQFFTYPVCSICNRGSSDEDFLFSTLLSFGLNQDSYLANTEPTDTDLLALHEQTQGHFQSSQLAEHRQKLLQKYIGIDPSTGREAVNIDPLPINRTTTKIVKAIFWLHTGGDILQNYNPGWWILPMIDASKEGFIKKHLAVSSADIQWEDKFISHYSIGRPREGADGFISCSLHFYSKRSVREGMSWFLISAPMNTKIGGDSIFNMCKATFGEPAINPLQ